VTREKLFDEMSQRDGYACTMLISLHMWNNDVESAMKLSDERPDRKNTTTLSVLIDGYGKLM